MSEIRVDSFKAEDGISAPSFPNGINVTGVVTASVLDVSVPFLDAGNNIQLGAAGIITATELKATNVSVAGTLTYEDVSNVDSIGIVTARAGLKVTSGEATVGSNIKLGNAGVVTATAFHGSGASLTGIDATALKDSAGNVKIQAQASGAVHTGIHTFSTVNTTTVTGNGSGLTNLNGSNIASGTVADARISTLTASKLSGALPAVSGANLTNLNGSNISSGTIASARIGTLNQNTTGSAATLDVANGSSNSTYYPVFTDNNGSAKTLSIDSGGSLQYNPSTNILTAGTIRGGGTVEVHSMVVNNSGDVGSGSNYFVFTMTPSIDWNKCIWGHAGSHRAAADSHYYAGYEFNKGSGDIAQHMRGFGRAQSATNHNQGWSATGTAVENNGSFMSGSANTGCTFKCYLDSGGNSGPANDVGFDHHAWVMFIHD